MKRFLVDIRESEEDSTYIIDAIDAKSAANLYVAGAVKGEVIINMVAEGEKLRVQALPEIGQAGITPWNEIETVDVAVEDCPAWHDYMGSPEP